MKDSKYDFTTKSQEDILIDDILREYQLSSADTEAVHERFHDLDAGLDDYFDGVEEEPQPLDRVDEFMNDFNADGLDELPNIDITPALKDVFKSIPSSDPNALPELNDDYSEYDEDAFEPDDEQEDEPEQELYAEPEVEDDNDIPDAEALFASIAKLGFDEVEEVVIEDDDIYTQEPEAETPAPADEVQPERVSAVSSMADEARRYIAGIQGLFGTPRKKKERKSLSQLRRELDEEMLGESPEQDEGEDEYAPDDIEEETDLAPAETEELPEEDAEYIPADEPAAEDEASVPEEPEEPEYDFDELYSSLLAERRAAAGDEPVEDESFEEAEEPEPVEEEPEPVEEEPESVEEEPEPVEEEPEPAEQEPEAEEGTDEPVEEAPAESRRSERDYIPLAPDKLGDEQIDADNIITPEYNKQEVEIDSRFNLGGHSRHNSIRFGSSDVDISAEDGYQQKARQGEELSHWIPNEEEHVVDEEIIGRRRISKKRQKQLEREEMLRRQSISETQVAEDYDEAEEHSDTDVSPAEYADPDYDEYEEELGEEDIHFNIDEDAFPPTFRAYLSSIVASFMLRLHGGSTNRVVTNSTMEDNDEDLGAEVSPAAAYKYYGSFIPFQRMRLRIAGFILLLLCYISIGLPVPGMLADARVAAAAALAMLLTIMLLSLDVFTNSVTNLFRLKFGADALASVSCMITCLDALIVIFVDSAAPHMPLCALSALSLYGVTLAASMNTRALRKSIRVPAIGKFCYAVTGEMKFKEKQLTLLKSLRSAKGFVRRAEEMPPDETLFNKLGIFIFIFSLLLSFIVSVVHKDASDMVFIISAVLCPAVPFTALLSFAMPYLFGANRIFKFGAAIAGWSGLCDIGTSRNLIITDRDIFPDNAVSIKEVKVFSDGSPEKVISYAGTLICASGSCISGCFARLMEENGCTMQTVNEFEYLSGGGIRGLIDGHQVLCGSTDFMRLMNVRISYRLTNKTTVLLAIDGVIYGIFDVEYKPLPQVRQALVELMRSSRHPVFAIRDFNVNPEMLHNCFDLATDGYDFPPYVERFQLSEASKHRDKDGKISAVICTEGLGPLTHTAHIGRSIYLSVKLNLIISIAASLIPMLTVFFKLLIAGAATPGFMLVLMLVWFIPVFLSSLFVLRP